MITDSQITDGEDIKLPTNMQWQQVVSLIFNNKANWTGVGNPSTNGNDPILNSADWGSDTLGFSSVIYKGYTDETNPPGKAADIDANGYTGVESYEKKRRTFVIANNISVRDRNNTIDIADDESVQVNDPAVASNYAAVIWDFSGNVSEWTRGLVAAKTETSYDGTVDGGDRFDTGDNESTEFDNVLHMAEGDGYLMPNWLEPVFAYDGDRIKSSKNLGKYNDGDNQAGSWCSHSQQGATPFNPSIGPINFGYGEGNEDAPLGGFSAVYRGGSYLVALDEASGLNTLSTASSPSFRFEHIGFRAASYTQKGTKGI
ncbi:MAG: hypothetical protein B6I26_03235 [Desulfobacteraceae bacterium 4572_130]|nr:MAG: hypothetical protein B6I26_03235 [Desulfobacteraceae bacterium 4572_130]